jgi:hypothetical protein
MVGMMRLSRAGVRTMAGIFLACVFVLMISPWFPLVLAKLRIIELPGSDPALLEQATTDDARQPGTSAAGSVVKEPLDVAQRTEAEAIARIAVEEVLGLYARTIGPWVYSVDMLNHGNPLDGTDISDPRISVYAREPICRAKKVEPCVDQSRALWASMLITFTTSETATASVSWRRGQGHPTDHRSIEFVQRDHRWVIAD